MELSLLLDNYTLILESFVVILVLYCLSFLFKTTNTAPEPSGAWPIIGHLKVFSNPSNLPHVALASMADRYGPIFTLRLGFRRVLVVSNWEIAKEIFTTHDVFVSDRPPYLAADVLAYKFASFAFAPYGSYWRQIHKIVSIELLSSSRIEKLKYIQISELENSVNNMFNLWREKRDKRGKVVVDMKKWFSELNMNTLLRMVAGKRYTGGRDGEGDEEMTRRRELIREWSHYLGMFMVADAFPFLRWLDLGGHEKKMKQVAMKLDSMVGKWLKEHRLKMTSSDATEEKDLIDVMIRAVDDDNLADYDADTIIKATCTSIISGAADSTSIMLTWTLSLLLNNRYALKKAQEEVDMQVGKDRQVNEADINNLVYLQAIIKESLRVYPASFLGGPRSFSGDCTVAGYHVPKGTWLLINVWKLQRDPKIWSDPSEFKPERFLTTKHKDVDVKGVNFELIPFGAGRRSCPGTRLALRMLHMVLATLLQNFEISTLNDAPIDMAGSIGVTNAMAGPLEVLMAPRLQAKIDA